MTLSPGSLNTRTRLDPASVVGIDSSSEICRQRPVIEEPPSAAPLDSSATATVASVHETRTDRVEFETLISDISARLIAAAPEQVEAVITDALNRVRTHFQAGRCGILRVSEDQTFVNVAYGAYAEGLPALSGDLNLAQLYPWARQKLLVERVPVIVYRTADLPPAGGAST
jgi:hypothetical protein